MANITDWIMCGLTAIYVIATIMILSSNRKSAKAAEKQIGESKLIQKQNAALQLLNRRINIYNILSEWVTIAKILCRNDLPFRQSLPLLHAGIFNNVKDVGLQGLKEQIIQLEQELLKDGVTKEQVMNVLDILKALVAQGTQIFFTTANDEMVRYFKDCFHGTTYTYKEYFFTKRINGKSLIEERQLDDGLPTEELS